MKPEGDLHFLFISFPLLGNRRAEKKYCVFLKIYSLECQELTIPMQWETMSDLLVLQASFSYTNPPGLTVLWGHALK